MEQQNRIDQLEAENQELLALMKQAYVKRETEKETIPVEEEWQKFATEHADELEALGSEKPHTATIRKMMGIMPYKVAASIIGILFTAGVAFAAIHIVRKVSSSNPQTAQTEQIVPVPSVSEVPTDTVKTDTIATVQPVVFDNVALEKMLSEIAAHYDAKVTFVNDEARGLRFRFVWNPQKGIGQVVSDLNQFERLTVTLKDDVITVE